MTNTDKSMPLLPGKKWVMALTFIAHKMTYHNCGCIAMDVEILPQLQLTDASEVQSLQRVFLLLQFFLPLHNQCLWLIRYDCFVYEMHCVVQSSLCWLILFFLS